MAIIIGIVSMFGLATHILGFDELVSTLNQHSNFSQMLNTLFGSVSTFASLVINSYYFAVIAHLLEAIYTVFLCTTKLKTKTIITFKWFLLVSAVGYPATSKVMEFCSIDAKKRKWRIVMILNEIYQNIFWLMSTLVFHININL